MNTVRLVDAVYGQGVVVTWPMADVPGRFRNFPAGTLATLVGTSDRGLVVVLVAGEAFEVWQENISTNYSLN